MRDIDRIPNICENIAELWKSNCPDWRFMQLINNFMAWSKSDGFYLEDIDFIVRLEKFLEEI